MKKCAARIFITKKRYTFYCMLQDSCSESISEESVFFPRTIIEEQFGKFVFQNGKQDV